MKTLNQAAALIFKIKKVATRYSKNNLIFQSKIVSKGNVMQKILCLMKLLAILQRIMIVDSLLKCV